MPRLEIGSRKFVARGHVYAVEYTKNGYGRPPFLFPPKQSSPPWHLNKPLPVCSIEPVPQTTDINDFNAEPLQCDLSNPCGKCAEVFLTAKLFKQPCQKLSLDDVVVFRQGNARAGETRSTFPKLRWSFDYPEIRTIHITYNIPTRGYGDMPRMPITCRQFVPQPTDVLQEPYEAPDGEVMWVKSPPFACVSFS